MSNVKITLSRGDLESLLCNDEGDIKVEIGHQIAQQFARKHLKGLIAVELESMLHSQTLEALKEFVYTENSKGDIILEEKVCRKIRLMVEREVNEAIHKAFDSASAKIIEKLTTGDSIKKEIEYRVRRELGKGITGKVSAAVTAALAAIDGELEKAVLTD
jgi:hypothetical protein